MKNDWQDAVRHIISVNNLALDRYNRWLVDAQRDNDAALETVARAKVEVYRMANDDLEMLIREYSNEREE